MSKRFPIPDFDRDQYKNMEWSKPALLPGDRQAALIAAQKAGDAKAFGCYPFEANKAFYEYFKLQGDQRHVMMCVLPQCDIKLTGQSFAWTIQRALVVDSLDPGSAKVLVDWKTPRPMNTRLGPDEGVIVRGGILYAVCSHRCADYWIVNRTLATNNAANGFCAVLSASDDHINDFHACNLFFNWRA